MVERRCVMGDAVKVFQRQRVFAVRKGLPWGNAIPQFNAVGESKNKINKTRMVMKILL